MDADGEVRLEQVARLLGLESEDEARTALGQLAYDDPGSGRLVPAPEYLSGKVREKLAEAEKAATGDPRFAVNVAALRRVLPADLGPGDIDARLGASWVPVELVQQGLREILQDPRLTVTKGHGTTWSVSGTQESVLARQVYGTSDKDAISLAQALLEQRPIKVSYSMDDLDREDRARLDSIRDRRDMQAFIRAPFRRGHHHRPRQGRRTVREVHRMALGRPGAVGGSSPASTTSGSTPSSCAATTTSGRGCPACAAGSSRTRTSTRRSRASSAARRAAGA